MKAFLSSISRNKRFVVAELFLVYFAHGLGSIMLGSVLPDLRAAYGLDYQLGGTLISSQSVGYLGIGLLSGILAVKWGLKRAYLILYYLFAVGFVMLLTGGSPLWLLAAMFLTGISKGGITTDPQWTWTQTAVQRRSICCMPRLHSARALRRSRYSPARSSAVKTAGVWRSKSQSFCSPSALCSACL